MLLINDYYLLDMKNEYGELTLIVFNIIQIISNSSRYLKLSNPLKEKSNIYNS